MRNFSHLAERVFNTPLLCTPEAAAAAADVLAERIGTAGAIEASASRDPDEEPPYALDAEGIATIPVHGKLVNRGSWIDAYSGLTSYSALTAALDQAIADPRVRGIVLDLDSPGGEAAGAFETAAHIRAVDARKPVVAYVDSLAASAGYALASGAREIIARPSATLGSIGVIWVHFDQSAALERRGVKPTVLTAGAFKADGHGYAPLADDVRARIGARIGEVYALFLDTVGTLRPKLGAEGARRTEAGIYLGQNAVAAGLADRVGGKDALKAAFPRKLFWSLKMPDEPIHTQAALDAAVAAARREAAAGTDAAVSQARVDERARIAAILDGEAAKGREALARHFAFKTTMSPEDAATALGAAPAAQADTPLARAMAAQKDPKIAAGGAAPADAAPRVLDTAAIYASRAAVARH